MRLLAKAKKRLSPRALAVFAFVAFAVILLPGNAFAAGGSTTPGAGAVFNIMNWGISKIAQGGVYILFNIVIKAALSLPEPNVAGDLFTGQFTIASKLALFLIVPFVVVATIGAIIKGGLKELLHTYLIGVPISVMGGVAAIAVVGIAQRIDAQLTAGMLQSGYADMDKYARAMSTPPGGMSLPMLSLTAITIVGMTFGAIFFLLEMVFRTMVIYMSVLFLPIAFAAYTWRPTRRWLYALIELSLTAIFAKFLAVSVLSMGFASISGSVGPAVGSAGEFPARLGYLIQGWALLAVASLVLPGLITFVMGPGTQLVGRQEGFQPLPFTMERQASRDTAISQAKQVGSLISGK